MEQNSEATSVELLRRVLTGEPVASAAQAFGLSTSAADQRIKRLARQLQATVGVERIDERAVPSTRLLRAHRAEYLEALEHYDPARTVRMVQAATEQDLNVMLERIRNEGRQPERDAALLLILFSTGLRPAELAGLQVQDYLTADGKRKPISALRPEIAAGHRARPVYFTNVRATEVLDAYLAHRARNRRHAEAAPYRGLIPDSPLLLARPEPDAEPFTANSLSETLRRLFRLAGRPGLSALSARRFVANRLAAMLVAERDIRAVLGLTNAAALRAMLVPMDVDTAMRKMV